MVGVAVHIRSQRSGGVYDGCNPPNLVEPPGYEGGCNNRGCWGVGVLGVQWGAMGRALGRALGLNEHEACGDQNGILRSVSIHIQCFTLAEYLYQ